MSDPGIASRVSLPSREKAPIQLKTDRRVTITDSATFFLREQLQGALTRSQQDPPKTSLWIVTTGRTRSERPDGNHMEPEHREKMTSNQAQATWIQNGLSTHQHNTAWFDPPSVWVCCMAPRSADLTPHARCQKRFVHGGRRAMFELMLTTLHAAQVQNRIAQISSMAKLAP